MERDLALQVARTYLRDLGETEDLDSFQTSSTNLARSLEALLPEVGDLWTLTSVNTPAEKDQETVFFALVEGQLYWARFIPAGDRGLAVRVYRAGETNWWVRNVADNVFQDETGVLKVVRSWVVETPGESFSFETDHVIRPTTELHRTERLGRAMAAVHRWEIKDVSADIDL